MTAPRTLVVGDDGTETSDTAWAWVGAQRWTGWRAEVVHAHTPPFGPPPPQEELELHPWEPPSPRVAPPGAGLVEVVHLTAELDPRLALSRPADLLVVGPPGPGLLKAMHLGSTAEWLLHHPPSPLVIARVPDQVGRVLLAADGSPHAAAVITALLAMPWIGECGVVAVVVDDHRTDVDAATRAVREAFDAAGHDVELVRLEGRPTSALLGAVDERAPDLVALGTRGLTGLHRLRVGSTASAVTRSAACNVLVACADSGPAA